ncbi:MAG: hypothetical protein LBU94_04550 [Clostridiales bacterium]|jgi:hypothetical protein|nr:hypothetical protein [Clostridiales bacterium]
MLGIKFGLSDKSIKNIISKVKMPLIMFDHVWLSLFPRDLKTVRMSDSEKRIVELMKENARLRDEKERLYADKVQAMDYINRLTPAAFTLDNKQAKVEMQKLKVKILRANSQMISIERRQKSIDFDINEENSTLIEETVIVCYNSMHESKRQIESLNPRIDQLREELKALITELSIHETRFDMTYKLLHMLVGKDIVNELDKNKTLQEKKKWFSV